jgi:hypothetical protein
MIRVTTIKIDNMARGGKRDGAGRKPTGLPTKSIVRRLSAEDIYILDNHDRLISELANKTKDIMTVDHFKTYKLKGDLVIKVSELIEAGIITGSIK